MKKYVCLPIICFIVLCCTSKPVPEPIVEPIAEIEEPVIEFEQEIIEMVRIQSGFFTNSEPVRVNSFYLGIYLVTQREFQDVMGINPSFFQGELLPVENITWIDAIEFCNRLSKREGLTTAYIRDGDYIIWNRQANGYRLPTDIEWEYACRAGTVTPFHTGNNITTNQANFDGRFPYSGNARMEYRQRTTPVGTFAANPWGVYDMHGNVWEWCWAETADNSTVQLSNAICVIRGGAWSSSGRSLHSSFRSGFRPHVRNNYIGFRVARNVD
jgi:formylglycine-generating enzyme required for sulfatase activity